MKREYNARPSTYPRLEVTEPVAGNYYPVNTMMSIDDGETELAVITDVTQGGASLANGSLELMVHRRTLADDGIGIGEPLNETMCGCFGDRCDCAGLTMRGRHWIVMGSVEGVHEARRKLSERLNFGPTLAFAPPGIALVNKTFSALTKDLPPNVKLQTLTSNYASANSGRILFRLSHMYSRGEHPSLSENVTIDLNAIFREPWLITKAEEMSLTANQNRSAMEANKYQWRHSNNSNSSVESMTRRKLLPPDCLEVQLHPMEVKTFLVWLHDNSKNQVVV